MHKQVFLLLFALLCGTLFATEEDLRHVRSLADRGLFDAAEDFCHEKLGQSDLDEADKILLVAELVLTYSQQLLHLESTRHPPIVRKIATLESTWLATSTDSDAPDLALAKMTLRLQLAMTERTLGNLHDALKRLKECQDELQTFRLRVGSNADVQLQRKMLSLEYAITMQQGIAQKSLALTFPPEERHVELQRAAATLSELAAKNSTEPVIVQCKVEKAACHRLCGELGGELGGELDRCKEILTPLLNTTLSPMCRLQVEAEWIRYNIAAGNVAEMRKQYAADRADTKLFPDFELARLELFLLYEPARNIRPEVAAAEKLQGTIRQFGPYWERRAGMLLGAQSSGTIEWNSAEILAAQAENHFRENRFTESATLYEQAASKAETNRQTENVFRYSRLAAAAWGKALEYASAESKTEYQNRRIALLRKLSVQHPNHPDAVELHLAAIDLQRQMPALPDEYLTLLQEHMETWKESPKIQRLRRETIVQLDRQGRSDEATALLPLLDAEQLATLSPAMQRVRVRQLDADGKTQEAVNILTALLTQKREPATVQLFAEILTRQPDKKSLEQALKFWLQLEPTMPKNTETWWGVREGIIEVLCKLNRHDEARESFKMLPILYPDLGGAERKERLHKWVN